MRIVPFLQKAGIALGVAAGLLLAAAPARAQQAPLFGGWYGALGVGFVGLGDTNVDYGGAAPNLNLEYYGGWVVSGALGCRVRRYMRFEVEISHRENDVYELGNFYPYNGIVTSTTYMVNGYYDFPVYWHTGFVPYIGLGVGRAQFTQDLNFNAVTVSSSTSHETAYQVIGGLEFPVIFRQMSVTLEFRYLTTSRPQFKDTSGLSFHTDYDSYSFLAGVRWAF